MTHVATRGFKIVYPSLVLSEGSSSRATSRLVVLTIGHGRLVG